MSSDEDITYPIPISRLAHRYYLYNPHHVAHLRRDHNITGVLIGTLPQSPSQNVFLGLPLELLAEEARLLVEGGIAYVVDDVEVHRNGLRQLSSEGRRKYMLELERQGREEQEQATKRAESKKEKALKEMPKEKRDRVRASLEARNSEAAPASSSASIFETEEPDGDQSEHVPISVQSEREPGSENRPQPQTDLIDSSSRKAKSQAHLQPYPITPTMSDPPIPPPPPPTTTEEDPTESPAPFSPFSPKRIRTRSENSPQSLPEVPSLPSYALYRHLHSKSYFMTPGLRFGCQYSVYPGDPLRFHAHFLARGYGWNEDIDLQDLVGGGRLGTGVKKGFLIGGPVEAGTNGTIEEEVRSGEDDEVRVFTFEWGGM